MLIGAIVLSYGIGAIPFALLVSRLFALPDPRRYGSGNVGATNVMRQGNKTAAVLSLLADSGKGGVAIFLARSILPEAALADAVAGLAAVLGHVTSPFLRFRGGRGVATALGVYLCWQPLLVGLPALAVWGGSYALLRYSSVASLTAVTAASGLCWFFMPAAVWWAALLINIIVVGRHYDNLRRLWSGRELKVGGRH